MLLIGMFDSPYVRRVAISMRRLGLPFEHRNWSVGADFDRIRAYSPLGRVPVLVLEDGTSLVESAAILDALDDLAGPSRALLPATGTSRREALRLMSLALAAGEKAREQFTKAWCGRPRSITRPGSAGAASRCTARSACSSRRATGAGPRAGWSRTGSRRRHHGRVHLHVPVGVAADFRRRNPLPGLRIAQRVSARRCPTSSTPIRRWFMADMHEDFESAFKPATTVPSRAVRSRNSADRRCVIGPGWPSPIVRPSTVVTAASSPIVPVQNTSSAQ